MKKEFSIGTKFTLVKETVKKEHNCGNCKKTMKVCQD